MLSAPKSLQDRLQDAMNRAIDASTELSDLTSELDALGIKVSITMELKATSVNMEVLRRKPVARDASAEWLQKLFDLPHQP
jgi:hypothetical protein